MGSRARTPTAMGSSIPAPTSSGMALNYGVPTGTPTQYATPTKANPYLTSSQYSDMQQHTPSGMYYQGGKFYEPYTVGTKQKMMPIYQTGAQFMFGQAAQPIGYRPYPPSVFGMNQSQNYMIPDIKEGSVQSGGQYFKPFTGNAQGIINGQLSMAGMAGQNTYQPQATPNLFAGLLAPSASAQQGGVGRFTGTPSKP